MRRAASGKGGPTRNSTVRREPARAPPSKARPLDIPASPYSSKPPSLRQVQSMKEAGTSSAPGPHQNPGDSGYTRSSSPKAHSSNGSYPSPHDNRDADAHARIRSGPGVSPLGIPGAAAGTEPASGGIGRGRLKPGEDPATLASLIHGRSSKRVMAGPRGATHGATGAEAAGDMLPAAAPAATNRAAAGEPIGPSSAAGESTASGGSAAQPQGAGQRPHQHEHTQGRRAESTQAGAAGAARPALGWAPGTGPDHGPPSGRERSDAEGAVGFRADSGHIPVHYVSDYYPSDTEHLVADSSYASAHIYGMGQGQGQGHAGALGGHGGQTSGQRAGKDAPGAAGPHWSTHEASGGGAGPAGDGVREQMNAALARMRHNNSAPRHRGQAMQHQVPRTASDRASHHVSAREDSASTGGAGTGSSTAQHAQLTHATHAATDGYSTGTPASAVVSRLPSHAHHDSHPHQHTHHHHPYQQHAHLQSARHHSPHRHALPHYGSAAGVDSAGPSFHSGPLATAFGRQASTTFAPTGGGHGGGGHGGGGPGSGRGHDLAVAARQASVAMSTGSARTGSVTAANMNMIPLMSTMMLATRRFAGAVNRGGGGGGGAGAAGDSGVVSRMGSMTYAPAGSGGSAVFRGHYAGQEQAGLY